jgi:phage FluMu protein Com
MRRSYHRALDQESLQRNWSLYRQKRHRDYSTKPPPGAKLVHWGPPVAIRCAHCHHLLGSCVTFRVDDLHGLVEDTARWTLDNFSDPAVLTGVSGKHPHWIHIQSDGRKATVRFTCPRCRTALQPRNAHRLAAEIDAREAAEIALD